MRWCRNGIGACAGLALCCGAAWGQTITVSFGQSIQQAINGAPDGAIIEVEPGTYFGPIQFANSASGTPKSLTIHSTGGAAVTTIDASTFGMSAIRCVDVPGVDALLEGFTITGGESTGDGGGVFVQSTTLTVRDCVIEGNTCDVHGAGLSVNLADVTVENCTFRENEATGVAGGIYGRSITGSLTIIGGRFESNSATHGGGIYSNLPVTMTGVEFFRNEARTTNGGGVQMVGRPLRATGCLFQENSATAAGGGVYLQGAPDVVIEKCRFLGNHAVVKGGGLAVRDSGSSALAPLVRNSAFVGNVSADSGGLFVGDSGSAASWVDVVNSTFAHNESSNRPAAVGVTSGSVLVMTNSSAWGDGTEELRVNGTATIRHCNIDASNALGSGTVTAASTANFLADPLFEREPSDGGDGWIDDDATVDVDEAANNDYGDLRLTGASPNIDRGDTPFYTATSGPLTDLSAAERGVNDPNVPDDDGVPVIGPIVIDVGAHEFQAGPVATACPCEMDGDDAQINVFDLLAFLDCWFPASGGAPCP